MKTLICCCCGKNTRGKQWWNRDKGYGICADCIRRMKEKGMSNEEIKSNYGYAGINYLED